MVFVQLVSNKTVTRLLDYAAHGSGLNLLVQTFHTPCYLAPNPCIAEPDDPPSTTSLTSQ